MNRLQRLGALAGLLGVLSLPGCADDARDEPDPSPGTSEPTESSSSPTATSTPTTEPAAGPEMVGDSAFLRAPEGYRVSEFGFGILNADRGSTTLTFADLGAVAVTTPRQLAANGLTNFRGHPEVSYDADLGGEPAYVAVGHDSSGPYVEYGAVRGGDAVVVSFAFGARTPEDEQAAVIAAVLASFRWS